jgi:hypothetical protein
MFSAVSGTPRDRQREDRHRQRGALQRLIPIGHHTFTRCYRAAVRIGAQVAVQLLQDSLSNQRRHVRAGDRVYRVGQRFGRLYIVNSGFFKLVYLFGEGREQVVGLHFKGDGIGRALSRLARGDVIRFIEKGRRDIHLPQVEALTSFMQSIATPMAAAAFHRAAQDLRHRALEFCPWVGIACCRKRLSAALPTMTPAPVLIRSKARPRAAIHAWSESMVRASSSLLLGGRVPRAQVCSLCAPHVRRRCRAPPG